MWLSASNKELILWWINNIANCSKSIVVTKPDFILESDASKSGWGGVSGDDSTGGSWSRQEIELHINYLEMRAALFTIQSFCKDKSECHVKIMSDNTTTVACINKRGSTKELLNDVTKEIILWCSSRKIYISAAHIPGVDNIVADAESRRRLQSDTEWKLDVDVFNSW